MNDYTKLKTFKSFTPHSDGYERAVMKKDQVVELWNFYREWYKELCQIRKSPIEEIKKIAANDEALKTNSRVVHHLSDTVKDKLYRDKLKKQSLERDIRYAKIMMSRVQRIRDCFKEVANIMWDRHNQTAEIEICWRPWIGKDMSIINMLPGGTDPALYKAILERKYRR